MARYGDLIDRGKPSVNNADNVGNDIRGIHAGQHLDSNDYGNVVYEHQG